MDTLDKALEILKENENENQSIVNFIESNPIFSVELIGKSSLVRGLSDQAWVYINSKDKSEFKELIKKLNKEDKFFAAVEGWMVPYIVVGRKIGWDVKTTRYVLPAHIELPKVNANVAPLDAQDAGFIHSNSIYNEFIDSNYFRDRIYKGFSAGITEEGKLVAWVLTQDDGAVAFLHVMEEHRRKGYANAVVLSVLEKIRMTGRQPYMYVSDNNEEAKQLATGLGFEREKEVHWFSLA
jgi:ribosomal protein S18 acetylase RimI-like enzyme